MDVEKLNFHHLRYFWAVAKEGSLTRTAARLRVAQSALSSQIRRLEEQLGVALFEREGRRLVLTEAGEIALAYADDIFMAGSQLVSVLEHGRRPEQRLRIGTVATLSRNFQESFVKPLLERPEVSLRIESSVLVDLLQKLERHALDLVLANQPPGREFSGRLRCRRIARQAVSIVGSDPLKGFRFPGSISGVPMIVPGPESDVRHAFDALCEQLGVEWRVMAEVDDMATMRLLVRDTGALAVVPSIVVRDELREGILHEHCVVPGLFETFYAIVAKRRFEHPLIGVALAREESDLLEAQSVQRGRPERRGGLSPARTRRRA